jgi:hypothetical protein
VVCPCALGGLSACRDGGEGAHERSVRMDQHRERTAFERVVGSVRMATETADARADHLRSLTVSSVTSLSGIAAGLISAVVASGATDTAGLYPLAGAILIQLPLLGLLKVDVDDFSLKDNVYVAFMTFSLWFVTWTILLTTGTTF